MLHAEIKYYHNLFGLIIEPICTNYLKELFSTFGFIHSDVILLAKLNLNDTCRE